MSGRIPKWTDADFQAVITDLAKGTPLASALGGSNRPGRTAFYQRLKEDPALAREYDAAMQQRASCRIDALLDVNERLLCGRLDPASAKVISQNLQWLAAKESPKQYGEKQVIEATGADGKSLFPEPKMDDRETARLLAFLLSRGQRAIEERGDLVVLPEAS